MKSYNGQFDRMLECENVKQCFYKAAKRKHKSRARGKRPGDPRKQPFESVGDVLANIENEGDMVRCSGHDFPHGVVQAYGHIQLLFEAHQTVGEHTEDETNNQ